MQYVHAIMHNLVKRSFLSNGDQNATEQDLKKPREAIPNKTNPVDSGCGDFDFVDYDDDISVSSNNSIIVPKFNYDEATSEKNLHKQFQNTKTLVTALENEIAESKDDVHYLHSQIHSAEEIFPKRWEICKHLKDACKQQFETMSNEMLKWKRKTERFDIEVKELEQRIGSWQCLIDRAKEVQVQEVDFYD